MKPIHLCKVFLLATTLFLTPSTCLSRSQTKKLENGRAEYTELRNQKQTNVNIPAIIASCAAFVVIAIIVVVGVKQQHPYDETYDEREGKKWLRDQGFGKNINLPRSDAATALHVASFEGKEGLVRWLIKKSPQLLNKEDSKGSTALHLAVFKGYKEIARMLVDAGANTNAKIEGEYNTLHIAAYKGYKEIVKMLVDAGADKDAKDNSGGTPLHLAAFHGYKEVAQILVNAKCNIDIVNKERRTPLHIAAFNGDGEVVQVLVNGGANKNLKDEDGNTPLQLAELQHSDESWIEILK